MKKNKLAVLLAAVFIFSAGVFVVRRVYQHPSPLTPHPSLFYCPMHPTYTSPKPGDCPICNMKLIPMEDQTQSEDQKKTVSLAKVCLLHNCKMANCPMELPLKPGEKVTCPVCGTHVAEAAEIAKGEILYYRHPMRPEVTSPAPKKDEMGMDYVPVYAEETEGEAKVPGQAGLVLSAEKRQMIGLKSEPLGRRELKIKVRASGRVAYDPDLYNAIAEYHEAVKAKEKVKNSPWPDVLNQAEALVRSSVLRLRQMGLSQDQINEMSRSSEQSTNLLLGEPGGTVWVYAQIYEYEIGLVRPGQRVDLTTPAYPGRSFSGVVKAVDPILSSETRSLKVRIEVPNREGFLKLEMYVNAAIMVDLGMKLAVPESAVLDTGERRIVFLDLGGGRIEPREVKVGQEAQGFYELLSGIEEGERVVTSANFLIDSESRLKAAISGRKDKKGEHRH